MKNITATIDANHIITIESPSLGLVAAPMDSIIEAMENWNEDSGELTLNGSKFIVSEDEVAAINEACTKAVNKLANQRPTCQSVIKDVLACAIEPLSSEEIWVMAQPLVDSYNILSGATPKNTFRTQLYKLVLSGQVSKDKHEHHSRGIKFQLVNK